MGKDNKTLRISSKSLAETMSDMDILVKLDLGKDLNLSKVLGKEYADFITKKKIK